MKVIAVDEVSSVDQNTTTVRDTTEKNENNKMKMIVVNEDEDTTVRGAEKEKKSAATEVPYLDLATFDWRSDKKLMKKLMQKKKPKMRTMTINLVPWTPRGYSSVRPRRKNMFRWLDLAASDVQISNAYMRLDDGSMWEYQKENWEKFRMITLLWFHKFQRKGRSRTWRVVFPFVPASPVPSFDPEKVRELAATATEWQW
ncbi:hypothetical protein ACLB2K_057922 [Fragaria x ananassa]